MMLQLYVLSDHRVMHILI